MASDLSKIGQGAVGGAATGAAFGPWGALAGGALGGILGAFTDDPPTADEMGIVPIDAREMAQEFLPSEDEMRTQRNDFSARNDQSSQRTAENMIASGMDPARAYAIADRNHAPGAARNERSQNAQRMTMMDNLAMQFKPYEMEREEDILNYNLATRDEPGMLESFIPIAMDMWSSQGLSNWGGGPGKDPLLQSGDAGVDSLTGYSGVSPNAKFNQYDFGQNVLDAPEPYYNERNGWRDPQLGNG